MAAMLSIQILILSSFHLPLVIPLDLYQSPNVKTAIFQESDITKSCWNHEEISILRARMIMQELLPKKIPRDFEYLIRYFRNAEEAVVRFSPSEEVEIMMMTALSDVVGGYLQAVAIPVAKEAYYAGNIEYATIEKLYKILADIKLSLDTDGGRWSRPLDMTRFSTKVTPLLITKENVEQACNALFVTATCPPGESRIAIPYLDYDAKPGAVALPLRARNLYSLMSPASSHLIVRFYVLARECLSDSPPQDTQVFNKLFIHWMTAKVVPHLYEDTFYPGFGSVMRIMVAANDSEFMASRRLRFKVRDKSLEESFNTSNPCGFVSLIEDAVQYSYWWILILILLLLIPILCAICFCCLLFGDNGGYMGICGKKESGALNAVLSIYCGLKDKGNTNNEPKISYQSHKSNTYDEHRISYQSHKSQKSQQSQRRKPSEGNNKDSSVRRMSASLDSTPFLTDEEEYGTSSTED